MKKRILSILLLCCMVLTLLPTAAFAADRTVRPTAQYTYMLHYDANGGSGAPPSQSMTSSNLQVSFLISDKIPTRNGYTFKGWADSPTGKPIYLRADGYYWYCNVVNGQTNSKTLYAIWEAHTHSWGEWTSNGNGTHKRTCSLDSSHTETGSCSGGKATGTEKAVCETCHTAYGELLQPVKTVITTLPTLPSEGYVGDEYLDEALTGGEAKAEGTGAVVSGSFRFKNFEGGRVHLGENRMEILFTPNDTEAYTTAECVVTVTGIKRTITSAIDVSISNKSLGTAFADLGLPSGVEVETNTGARYSPIPVTWDGSTYDPNKYGEQIITGELHVEKSGYTDQLEPAGTVKAAARITLIDDRVVTPTLDPPTYSKRIYSGDFCQLAFSDEYLSGGMATVNGETVSGVFTLNDEQEKYGYWRRDGGLVQVGPLELKVTFTPNDLLHYSTAECTVNVNVIPRTFREANTAYIDNKKIGTAFGNLDLPNVFNFFAEADGPNHEGSGLNGSMSGIIKWDDSNYDPNSYDEQTIYGEVDRAEFEKYFIIPEGAELRGVIKVTLQADAVETEITQSPVFQWKNGDFMLPDNTIFVDRIFEMGSTGGETANFMGGEAKIKGTDTVVPGTFSFKEGTPSWFGDLGENVVTVVFTPTDLYSYRKAETTIKINVIKNTLKSTEEPDPITHKALGTPFAGLGLPQNVVAETIDGNRVGMEVSWDESSYDAQSTAWQNITGTLVFSVNDEYKYQQPEPAVTAKIRVKLIGPESAPAITTTTLPGGTVGTPYNHQLHADGEGLILWEIISGALPAGLKLKETTGEISGTPTADGTATFTVKATNSVGNDKKELSITITKAPAAERTITVTTDDNGTASASSAKAVANTEITLTATPDKGYHFKEWQVISPAGLVITNNKFTMPNGNVEVKAIFEEDAPSAEDLVDPVIRIIPYRDRGYPAQSGTRTAADFFKPGEMPEGAKITTITPPASASILDSISVDGDGTLSYAKDETITETVFKSETYTVTITGDDCAPISAPLTVRQYLDAGFQGPIHFGYYLYGDTYTYTCQVTNPGKNGVWSALIRNPDIFEIYQETTDITSEPGKSIYTVQIRAIKASAGVTCIDFLYFSDTTMASSKDSSTDITGGYVSTRPLTVTAGSASITKGDELPTDLVTCSGLLDSEGRRDDRDTVLENALSYWLLEASGVEVAADTARNTPGTYTVVPAAALKSSWSERYSLNKVNGTLTVEDKVDEQFTVTFDGNGGTPSVGSMTTKQKLASLPGASRSSYSFDGWYTKKSGGTKITTDTLFTSNTTVYAHWTYTGSGSSGGSGSTSYTISIRDAKNGSVIANRRSAPAGATVTITVKPDNGYELETISVTGRNGNDLKLTDKGNGKYTFTMPGGKVEVKVSFMEKNSVLNFFYDVPNDAYYYEAVKWAMENGITGGIGNSLFAPNQPCTRAQIVTFLWRAAGSPEPKAISSFTDVPADSYYAKAVAWAVENGITTGTGNGKFSPDAACTRAQAVAFLFRAAVSNGLEAVTLSDLLSGFEDAASVPGYAAPAMNWALSQGIVKGSGTQLLPGGACTRAQIVTFLYRAYQGS